MSRRSLVPLKPGNELPVDVPAARHRLSATLGAPDSSGQVAGPGDASGAAFRTGLLAPVSADDPLADQTDVTPSTAPGEGQAVPGVRRRTGLRASALLGAVCLVLGGWFWWNAVSGAPEVVPLSEVSSAGADQQGAGSRTESSPARDAAVPEAASITVHVAGAVTRPGIVELPPGSRLHEALTAAGGATGSADPDRLNLAANLEDGQKIIVPERGQPGASSGAATGQEDPGVAGSSSEVAGPTDSGSDGTGSAAAGGTRINLNTAGIEELSTLPRVGPVLAQRIVDWRKQHGRFQTVDELDAVDGVGPKLLEALLPLVRV